MRTAGCLWLIIAGILLCLAGKGVYDLSWPSRTAAYDMGVNDALDTAFWLATQHRELNLGELTELTAKSLGVERKSDRVVHAK